MIRLASRIQKPADQPRRALRFFSISQLTMSVVFLALLASPGCVSPEAKQARVPQPLPGRTARQAIQSRPSAAFFSSKATVLPESGDQTSVSQVTTAAPAFSWPPGFDRVAVLPIYTTTPTGGAINDLDEIFRAEMAKLLPLEVVSVSRADMLAATGEAQFASTAVIPEKLIQFLQTKYAVQGIIFTDLPIYRPYRPINISVRSKMVRIPDLGIMWSASGVLDSAEPGIAESALQYAERNLHGSGRGDSQLILQSPRRYAAFVANGIFGTLPTRSAQPGELTSLQQ